MLEAQFDPRAIAAVFAETDRELWLLTAAAEGRRGGLIATSVASASIASDLPRVVVGIGRQHFTWELLRQHPHFVLHLLRPDQIELAWAFATASGRDADKFANVPFEFGARSGCPILKDAPGWLECRIEASMDVGDRTLHVAEVVAGAQREPGAPLTVQRLIRTASADRLRLLKEQMAHHAAIDAAAIRAFREERRGKSEEKACGEAKR